MAVPMKEVPMATERKLSAIKDKQERQWAIEDAARTLKKFASIKRDKELLKAARAYLKQEIADSQKVLKTT